MQVPLEIVARNVHLDRHARALITERVARLETLYPRLTSCRLAAEVPHRHQRSGTEYVVRIDLTVPRREIVVRRKSAEALLTALQSAFQAAERRLGALAKRRGATQATAAPPRARVLELYPLAGYGYLETREGDLLYFDRRGVRDGDLGSLVPGAEVAYLEGEGAQGPTAHAIHPVRARTA